MLHAHHIQVPRLPSHHDFDSASRALHERLPGILRQRLQPPGGNTLTHVSQAHVRGCLLGMLMLRGPASPPAPTPFPLSPHSAHGSPCAASACAMVALEQCVCQSVAAALAAAACDGGGGDGGHIEGEGRACSRRCEQSPPHGVGEGGSRVYSSSCRSTLEGGDGDEAGGSDPSGNRGSEGGGSSNSSSSSSEGGCEEEQGEQGAQALAAVPPAAPWVDVVAESLPSAGTSTAGDEDPSLFHLMPLDACWLLPTPGGPAAGSTAAAAGQAPHPQQPPRAQPPQALQRRAPLEQGAPTPPPLQPRHAARQGVGPAAGRAGVAVQLLLLGPSTPAPTVPAAARPSAAAATSVDPAALEEVSAASPPPTIPTTQTTPSWPPCIRLLVVKGSAVLCDAAYAVPQRRPAGGVVMLQAELEPAAVPPDTPGVVTCVVSDE